MMQHALKLWICLHPADVGAVNDRPRAIDNRPYGFYRKITLFCNRPMFDRIHGALNSAVKGCTMYWSFTAAWG